MWILTKMRILTKSFAFRFLKFSYSFVKKCYVLIFKKDIWKKKKTLLQWILQNILENQAFHRTAKFIEMKGIVIRKRKWDAQYFEKPSSHWLLAEAWRFELLSKWMHFQHVLSSGEFQQITDLFYMREIAER